MGEASARNESPARVHDLVPMVSTIFPICSFDSIYRYASTTSRNSLRPPNRFLEVRRFAVFFSKTAMRYSRVVRPRDRCCPYLVLIPYDLCCTLSDDHTGSHGIAGCHAWHDGSIRDAKVVDAVYFEVAIHHTHGVAPHLGRGCLMPKAKRCVADVVF